MLIDIYEWLICTDHRARFQEITEPPYTQIDAPRVGYDEEADQWLLERLTKANQRDDFEAVREKMHGHYVSELSPDSDGFPMYSNWEMALKPEPRH